MYIPRRFWTLIVISSFAVILLLLGGLFFYQNAYAGKIYKNVSVGGIDVSGKTKKQAAVLINKKFDNILNSNIGLSAGEKSITAKLLETGFSFDVNKTVTSAYSVGRSRKFFPQLYASAKTSVASQNISVPILIDNTKLSLFISEKIPELNIEPKDAHLNIGENGEISIIPEVIGQNVDSSSIAEDLSKLISSGGPLNIKLNVISSSGGVTSAMLEDQKYQAEKYINTQVQLKYESLEFFPSKQEISKWITFSTNSSLPNIILDKNRIKSYLTIIAKNFEIAKKDKKINALDNSVLEEGQQGKYLDKNSAADSIVSVLDKNGGVVTLQTYTEDPKEVRVYPAEGIIPGRFEGKYLDVDLAQQKMCQIEGNNVINCFVISSGKPSMPTPIGTRYIDSKETRRWSNTYGLWMPYWQSLGGGYGIHELPEWPGGYKEGENHLGTPVSHGCIRLGIGSAEAVFNWTEVGTPVYIHK